MKQKFGFVLLLVLLLVACAPAQQPAVDVPSEQEVIATEVHTALPADTPTPAATAAPPSATPVPQAIATSGAGCASNDAAKLGESIAEGFAFTSPDEVLTWFCNGAEFEDILVALQTEELTGVPSEDMLSMLADGFTWDDIWQAVGLTNE